MGEWREQLPWLEKVTQTDGFGIWLGAEPADEAAELRKLALPREVLG